ncbi:sensor histidine kinase [Pedobacter agri]|uniref:sensor histidine kinase n=1 Tax=Pedobacter agri TaxID=454586 RepID=UPI00292F29F5|nr:ATP-binding protein [Pedobacter agri]
MIIVHISSFQIAVLLSILLSSIIAIYLILSLFRRRKFGASYRNEYFAQSQSIKLERQRISSELHDELGSGLSAIKLYAELSTKRRPEIEELLTLNIMIKEISVKINDIIWTTSTENDQLDVVLFYIQEQIHQMFKFTEINVESNLPEVIPVLKIKSESRRDIYLLAKEIAHNSLKHAHANTIYFSVSLTQETLSLTIRDDGEGFDPLTSKSNGMGLTNMKVRAERLKAKLTIENYKGTKIIINIPFEGNFYKNM